MIRKARNSSAVVFDTQRKEGVDAMDEFTFTLIVILFVIIVIKK